MKPIFTAAIAPRLTRHAAIRMQQRCIPHFIVELLLDYGVATPVGGGALSYRFTRLTWANALAALDRDAGDLARYRNAYVIEAEDGAVITAAWSH